MCVGGVCVGVCVCGGGGGLLFPGKWFENS